MRRIRYGVACIAATAFLISGCGSGDGVSTSAGVYATAPADLPEKAAPVPAVGDAGTGGTGASAPAAGQGGSGQGVSAEPRTVIRTAQLTVHAKDVAGAADKARQIVAGVGGHVSEEKTTSEPGGDIAVVTFKVPPERYTDVLAQLGRDLGKRAAQHQSEEDVTEEVADVDSRVKSAEASLAQFRLLLSKATKISEIMAVEQEISSREADLESLQARQRSLAGQTAMATITLTVTTPPRVPKTAMPAEPDPSFLSGLKTGWDALASSTTVALAVLGALLPWLVVGAVIWVAVVAVRRRFLPGPAAAAPRPETPAVSQEPAPVPREAQDAESS
ncbi:lipoprotein [Planotetraspora thailandica]|uniref:Lipoprotein n=1 Tax=Planotetraspora thailandica TaxID=487172 RepID=A0A8J3XWA6_9ACTN|nr:DUF4349 domain-containing protein [Planotetraspora thailandica]GII54546.1 lipoprotein [Planotetraspora thailandica]